MLLTCTIRPSRRCFTCLLPIALVSVLTLPGYAEEGTDKSDKSTAPKAGGTGSGTKTYKEVGEASWYGPGFHGEETASGETFDQNKLTAAHRRLPLGTKAEVTNLENGKKVEVEINDRGPYAGGRDMDLSRMAAQKLGMKEDGTAKVKIEAKPEKNKNTDNSASATK
ncbi:MAG: septal ring lytic transglycosylase RlpA family protein [Candidatus Competibacteraceae bacterium]